MWRQPANLAAGRPLAVVDDNVVSGATAEEEEEDEEEKKRDEEDETHGLCRCGHPPILRYPGSLTNQSALPTRLSDGGGTDGIIRDTCGYGSTITHLPGGT